MKKKTIILIIAMTVILLTLIITYHNKSNLIKLNYSEIIEKINNKESFVLCVSASECIHCKDYKPKLEKISRNYNIIIYYTNVDTFTKEELEEFKSKLSFDGGTPTTIFFINGEEKTTATRIEGNVKSEKVINKLKKNGFITE